MEEFLKTAGECHAMLDIETLGTDQSAVILQIAAVRFWPYAPTPAISTADGIFNVYLDPEQQPDRLIDASTVKWWMRKKPEAQRRVFAREESGRSPLGAMTDFAFWCREIPIDYWWAKPPSFDFKLVKHLWNQHCKPAEFPVPFRKECDLRTLKLVGELIGTQLPPETGVAHDAVDDCYNQAGVAITILRAIKEKLR